MYLKKKMFRRFFYETLYVKINMGHATTHRRKPRPKCTILSQSWPWLNKWIFLGISLTVLTNAGKAWSEFNLSCDLP